MERFNFFEKSLIFLTVLVSLLCFVKEGQSAIQVASFYAYSSYDTCVAVSAGGFLNDAVLTQDAVISSYVNTGVADFRSDGTVYYTGKGTQIEHNEISAGKIPVKNREIPVTCEGTYIVDGRNIEVSLTCSGVFDNGLKFITTDINVEGFIGVREKVIQGSNIKGNVQHTTILDSNDNVIKSVDQICIGYINLIETVDPTR